MRRFALAALVVLPLCACQSVDVPDDRELTVEVVAMPQSAAVGEEVAIRAFAEGMSLVRIDFDFGDGETATSVTHGAQTAEAEQMHAYQSSGTFAVTATAVESGGGAISAETTVTVTGGS